MGKRGPKPDPDQALKGFPGRRRSKADRVAQAAAATAALLAPASGASAELPAMLIDLKYAPAAEVWKRLAPELRRTHRLPLESETAFVMLCVYAQEWVAATEDLHLNGFHQSIATVAGGKMERRRPGTLDRQQAFANFLDLSRRFGLTPMDMYDLFKGQAAVAVQNPGLFGEDRQQPAATPEPASTRIGAMSRMRSEPPADRLN